MRKEQINGMQCSEILADVSTPEFALVQQIASSLGSAIDAKDSFTSFYSRQIAGLARCMASHLGLSARQVEMIHLAGKLQDIGKIGIPDAILQKNGPLTEEEWKVVRRHPVIGARIIAPVQAFNGSSGIAKMVLHHHERWDGRGYPNGLKAIEIPLGARILMLSESLTAMLQNRPYRPRLSLGQALEEVRRGAGQQFDPALSALLVRMVLRLGIPDDDCGIDLLVTRLLCLKVLDKALAADMPVAPSVECLPFTGRFHRQQPSSSMSLSRPA